MSQNTPDPDDIFENQTPDKLGGSFDDMDNFDFTSPPAQPAGESILDNSRPIPSPITRHTGTDPQDSSQPNVNDQIGANAMLDIDSIGPALDNLPTTPPSKLNPNKAHPIASTNAHTAPVLASASERNSPSTSQSSSQSTSWLAGLAFLACVSLVLVGLFAVAICGVQFLTDSQDKMSEANMAEIDSSGANGNFALDDADELDREIEDLRNEFNLNQEADIPDGGPVNAAIQRAQGENNNFPRQPGGVAEAQLAPIDQNTPATANDGAIVPVKPMNVQVAPGNGDQTMAGNRVIPRDGQPFPTNENQQPQLSAVDAVSQNSSGNEPNRNTNDTVDTESRNNHDTKPLRPATSLQTQFASAFIDSSFNIVSNQDLEDITPVAADNGDGFKFQLFDPIAGDPKNGTPVVLNAQAPASIPLVTKQFEIPKENVFIHFDSTKNQIRVTVSPSRPEKEILIATLHDLTRTITRIDYKALGVFRFPRDGGRVINKTVFEKFSKALTEKTLTLKQLFESKQFLREQHQRLSNYDDTLATRANDIESGTAAAKSSKLKNIESKRSQIANSIAELRFAEHNVDLFRDTIEKITRGYAEIYLPESFGLFLPSEAGSEQNQKQLIQHMRLTIDGITASEPTITSRSSTQSNVIRVSPAIQSPSVQPN